MNGRRGFRVISREDSGGAEKDLIATALGGDEEAFERLYRQYRDRVYNFAYRMLGKKSTAEDVVQDVFLALMRHPERYDPARASLVTFLCAIARNQVLHILRRSEANGLSDERTEFPELVDRRSEDPLRNLIREEMAAKVKEAVQQLSPPYREVIVLREYQELSYEEIAAVTGSDISLVKVRLHRARQSLARLLNPYLKQRAKA